MIYTSSDTLVRACTVDKVKKPIYKVRYFDAPFGVPSYGMQMRVYNRASSVDASLWQDSDLVFVGQDPILSHDWDDGAPPGLNVVDKFSIRWYGYFYAEFTGQYTFITNSAGSARMYMAGDSNRNFHPSGLQSSHKLYMPRLDGEFAPDESWSHHGQIRTYVTSGSISLTAGNWYPFRVEYQNLVGKAAISVQYVEPYNTVSTVSGMWGDISGRRSDQAKKILSAGIANYSVASGWRTATDANVGFVQPKNIRDIVEINGSRALNQSAQYIITVPLTNKGEGGYYYNFELENYFSEQMLSYVRRGRLIEISAGYQTSCANYNECDECDMGHHNGGSWPNSDWFIPVLCQNGGNESCPDSTPNSTDYIVRFRGVITDFEVHRERKNTQLDIICQDHTVFLNDSINENWPDNISYANAGTAEYNSTISRFAITKFYGEDSSSITPNGRPKNGRCILAYDAWPVVDAVRDIYTKAGVDPSLQFARRKIKDYDGGIGFGNYLLEDKEIVLSRNTNYGFGNEFLTDKDKKDDKYLWGFQFGEKAIDMLSKMSDAYGYQIGFSNEGYALFSSRNNFTAIDSADSRWKGPAGTSSININATEGTYFRPDPVKYIQVAGSKFDLAVVLISGSSINRWSLIENEIFNHVNESEVTWDTLAWPFQGPPPKQQIDVLSRLILWGNLDARRSGLFFGNDAIGSGYQTAFFFRPDRVIAISGLNFNVLYDYTSIPGYSVLFKDDFKVNMYLGVKSQTDDISFHSSYGNGFQVVTDLKPFSLTGMRNRDEYDLEVRFDSGKQFVVSGGYIYMLKIVSSDLSTTIAKPFVPKVITALKQVTLLTDTTNENLKYGYFDPQYGYWSQKSDSYFGRLLGKTVCPDAEIFGTNQNPVDLHIVRSGYGTVFYRRYPTQMPESLTEGKVFRFVYDGVSLRTGNNPCILSVKASDLTAPQEDLIRYPFYNYEIHVSGAGGPRIDELRTYDIDIQEPLFFFSTGDDNGTIIQMDVDDNSDDIRNDVIVVGSQLGPLGDSVTQRTLNPNNPINRHVYSRVVDIDSVYRIDSIYNIGRRKPFIIFEPGIIKQDHADALAISVADRYRWGKKTPTIQSIGVPFIEVGDPVAIHDARFKTLGRFGSTQWVESYSENMKPKSYLNSYTTTPYIPWPSIDLKREPNISNFNNKPFVNILLTDDTGDLRISGLGANGAYDPYESEGSSFRIDTSGKSRYLKVSFDQVLAGEVKIYIVPVNNQPYWAENFKFNTSDAAAVAFLRPNGTGFDNQDWYSQEWGHYELFWDGIDYTGWSHFNQSLRDDEDISRTVSSKNIYVHDGRYMVVFKYRPLGSADEEFLTVRSELLDKTFNNPSNGISINSTSYRTYFDIQKSGITYIDCEVSPTFVTGFPNWDVAVTNSQRFLEFSPSDNGGRGLRIQLTSNNSSGTRVTRLLAQRLSASFWHWGRFTDKEITTSELGSSGTPDWAFTSPFNKFEINGERYITFEDTTFRIYNEDPIWFNPTKPEWAPQNLNVNIPWNIMGLPSYMNPKTEIDRDSPKTFGELFDAWSTASRIGATWVSEGYLLEFDIWDRSGRYLSSSAGTDMHYSPKQYVFEGASSNFFISSNFKLRAYINYTGQSRSYFGDTTSVASGDYFGIRTNDVANPTNALYSAYWKSYNLIRSNLSFKNNTGDKYPVYGHGAGEGESGPGRITQGNLIDLLGWR